MSRGRGPDVCFDIFPEQFRERKVARLYCVDRTLSFVSRLFLWLSARRAATHHGDDVAAAAVVVVAVGDGADGDGDADES